MRPQLQRYVFRLAALSLLLWLSAIAALAQSTSFTYQGRLTDGGTPANGNYDLQFTLFDSLSGGTQVGATQSVSTVAVGAGIFTVQLDFGANAFPGANRWLAISARLSGVGSFVPLAPPQQISSTPYAIRSLVASSADAVTVNGVPGGSGNYVQNTTTPQAGANFNISGNGTAAGTLSGNIVNAARQYNIDGRGVLLATGAGMLVGRGAGEQNTTGGLNAFFGDGAGGANLSGDDNTFVGSLAGLSNTSGSNNAFFGSNAGEGSGPGTGKYNAFFGSESMLEITSGSNNTGVGGRTSLGSGNLTNATAIGANTRVDQSNSLVLGSVAGVNGATASVNVGIGTTTPQARLWVKGDTVLETGGSGGNIQLGAPNGETGMTILKTATSRADVRFDGTTLKLVAATGVVPPASTNGIAISTTGNVGIGTISPVAKLSVRGPGTIDVFRVDGSSGLSGLLVRDDRIVVIGQLSSLEAASTHVCVDSVNRLSFCTSSLRYKQQVAPYRAGLDLIRRLHPISFIWKGNGTRDFGLAAEDVAKVEPLLVTHNNAGEIQGVKYDQLNVVLINAIKQQQTQIETLQKTNVALSARLLTVEKTLKKRVGPARVRLRRRTAR